MEETDRLLGLAQGLAETSEDVSSLKKALSAALNALSAVSKELAQLRKDYDELNEYVTRIDEDLSGLELMHDEEEEYDKYPEGDDEGDEEEGFEPDEADLNELLGKLFQNSDGQNGTEEDNENPSGLIMWKNDEKDE